MNCIDCKYFKAYEKINGGKCSHVNSRLIHNDIEYPNSWGCSDWKTNKASFIEKLIKWITRGKY